MGQWWREGLSGWMGTAASSVSLPSQQPRCAWPPDLTGRARSRACSEQQLSQSIFPTATEPGGCPVVGLGGQVSAGHSTTTRDIYTGIEDLRFS